MVRRNPSSRETAGDHRGPAGRRQCQLTDLLGRPRATVCARWRSSCRQLLDFPGDVEHGDLGRVADVHGPRVGRKQQSQQPAHPRRPRSRGSGFGPVPKTGRASRPERRVDEFGHGAAVVLTHARAVGVENARCEPSPRGAMIRHGHGFREPLGLVVNTRGPTGLTWPQ